MVQNAERYINKLEIWKIRFHMNLVVILGTFTTDTASQLDVFGHNGHALGMDSAQVGVLEKTNKVGFGCFLQGKRKFD